MAGSFGDADGVRRLGQALLTAGQGAASVASDLSRQVGSVVPAGWAGDAAEAFSADWHRKAGRAGQLAAVCTHVGHVLIELADELDAAGQNAVRAQQATGGPAGARFGDPVSGQRAEQTLSRAAGAADQARAAARSKLTGLHVPRIGPPLTASEVEGWAAGLTPGRVPVFNRLFGTLLGDVRKFAQHTGLDTAWGEAEKQRAGGPLTLGQEAHFAEGIVDGLTGMVRGAADLLPGPDGGLGRWLWGDPSASQSLQGLSHLAAPFLGVQDPDSPSALEDFGKGLVAWKEWHTDPARAAGNVTFNIVSLFAGTKLLRLGSGPVSDTGKALDTDEPGDVNPIEVDPRNPGPPPQSFRRPRTEPPRLRSPDQTNSGGRSNFMAKGEAFSDHVALTWLVDGYHDVIIHGSGTDFGPTADAWQQGTNFSHRVLARLIRKDPSYSGGPIRLLACSRAEGATAAQNLANKLGVEVLAPNDTLWAFPDGSLTVGPTPLAPLGGWEHFYPGGKP